MTIIPLEPTGPGWLFCPADRPDRFTKAAAAADVVIVDLEDAVAASNKAAARQALIDTPLDPTRTVVRINAGPEQAADLAALERTDYTVLMVPKCETADQIRPLAPRQVIALVETPRGVLAAPELAAAVNTIGLMWGAEDLTVSLGGRSSRGAGGRYRDVARHTRSVVLLAATAHGCLALDAVHLDIADSEGLAAEAADAAASGFAAVACIHPAQVAVVRAEYQPSVDELDWARSVLTAAQSESGVFTFRGRMVDEPVLRQASVIVRRSAVH